MQGKKDIYLQSTAIKLQMHPFTISSKEKCKLVCEDSVLQEKTFSNFCYMSLVTEVLSLKDKANTPKNKGFFITIWFHEEPF